MDIYLYQEYNGCKNTGYPVRLGNEKEFLETLSEGVTAVAATEKGDISGTTLCLGCFDGVHIGHQKLLETAKNFGSFGVLLFDRDVKNTPILTTMYEKTELLRMAGADYVIIAEFSEKFRSRSPEEFAELLAGFGVSRVAVGFDYRFGKNAEGDVDALMSMAGMHGFEVSVTDAVDVEGETVKSTKIREYIEKGDIPAANKLLGYAYVISGKVEKGLENGHKLGFPTANICYDERKQLPPDGVYRGRLFGRDAAVNIGSNPTFNADVRTVEAHLLDFDGDLYGKLAKLELYEKIRDDMRFDGMDELRAQIARDVEFVKGRQKNGKKNIN